MVCYVADLMDFDLTRGWYKHGYYSRSVDSHMSSYPSFEELDVETDIFREAQQHVDETFIYKLDANIRNRVTDKFVKDGSIFYKWIYSDLAPSNYRDFYNYNREFTKSLEYLIDAAKKNEPQIKEDLSRVDKALSNLRSALRFIKDDEILDVYLRFSDLLRMLMIKFRKDNTVKNIDLAVVLALENLFWLYINSQSMERESTANVAQYIFPVTPLEGGDIWTILTPYRETLIGQQKDEEIIRHTKKIQTLKPNLLNAIGKLKEFCEDYKLLPSMEDIKAEIRRIDTQKRAPLREIFCDR